MDYNYILVKANNLTNLCTKLNLEYSNVSNVSDVVS